MKPFDSLPLFDREWHRMLEESAEDERAEQDQLRSDKGRLPLGTSSTPGLGAAIRSFSNSIGLAGVVEPRPDHPSR